MNVLIIGGAGYIGSHLAVEHINKKHNVVIVDNLQNSEEFIIDNIREITKKDFTFHAYNATNETLMESVFEENNFDMVVLVAGEVSNVRSIDNPTQYLSNNINVLLTTLKLMEKCYVRKMVYASSSEVYGISSDKPINEGQARKLASSAYAVSKQICEDIIQTMNNKINVAIMRYFNPIGCHSSGKLGCLPKTGSDNIINALFDAYLNKSQFNIKGENYKTSDGTCVRDYISIDDLINAHMKAVTWLMDVDATEAFNICSGKGYSVKQILDIFQVETNEKLNVIVGNRRKGDLGNVVGNPDKAYNILNFYVTNNIKYYIMSYKSWYEYVLEKNKSAN